jgi:hypothetical protein
MMSNAIADDASPALSYAYRIRATSTDKPFFEREGSLRVGESHEDRFTYDGASYIAVMSASRPQRIGFRDQEPMYELRIYRGKIDRKALVRSEIFPYPDRKPFECGVGGASDWKPIIEEGLSRDGSARKACAKMWESMLADYRKTFETPARP